jgi:hypothetical protein
MRLRRLPRPNVLQTFMTVCAGSPLRRSSRMACRKASSAIAPPSGKSFCHALIVKLHELVQGTKCNSGEDLMADEFDRERTIRRRYF